MNIKASTRYVVEDKDTTLLPQVDLMSNNTASQVIHLSSLKDPKEKKKTMMVKKACQDTVCIRKFKLMFCKSKHFKIFNKLQNETKEKLAALRKVLQNPHMSK